MGGGGASAMGSKMRTPRFTLFVYTCTYTYVPGDLLLYKPWTVVLIKVMYVFA